MARNSVGPLEAVEFELLNYGEKMGVGEEGRVKSGGFKNRSQNSAFLNHILNKMEKFGSCEKLMDR
jgi:hypothetical protein